METLIQFTGEPEYCRQSRRLADGRGRVCEKLRERPRAPSFDGHSQILEWRATTRRFPLPPIQQQKSSGPRLPRAGLYFRRQIGFRPQPSRASEFRRGGSQWIRWQSGSEHAVWTRTV
jgi:hypothetical protein